MSTDLSAQGLVFNAADKWFRRIRDVVHVPFPREVFDSSTLCSTGKNNKHRQQLALDCCAAKKNALSNARHSTTRNPNNSRTSAEILVANTSSLGPASLTKVMSRSSWITGGSFTDSTSMTNSFTTGTLAASSLLPPAPAIFPETVFSIVTRKRALPVSPLRGVKDSAPLCGPLSITRGAPSLVKRRGFDEAPGTGAVWNLMSRQLGGGSKLSTCGVHKCGVVELQNWTGGSSPHGSCVRGILPLRRIVEHASPGP